MTSTTEGKRAYAPRMSPEDRREQILDAALRVIVEQGIHKVSIDSVAKAAGITRPVVYGHFEDSDALLRASLDREEQRALAQWALVMPTIGSGNPSETALAGFSNFLDVVEKSPDLWRAVFVLVDSSTPAFRRRLEHGRELALEGLEGLVIWAVAEGLDPDTDVELTSRMLLAVLWESGRLLLAEPQKYRKDRLVWFAAQVIATHLGQV